LSGVSSRIAVVQVGHAFEWLKRWLPRSSVRHFGTDLGSAQASFVAEAPVSHCIVFTATIQSSNSAYLRFTGDTSPTRFITSGCALHVQKAKTICIHRESNPNLLLGRQHFVFVSDMPSVEVGVDAYILTIRP
jgi:hypothetical protein